MLERFWRAEIPSRATLNLSLHCQPYQHGANCRSRQLAAFDNVVNWGWNIINILKLRLRCAEVASGRLFHQIVALQLRILGKYLRQSPPVSLPLEVKHVDHLLSLYISILVPDRMLDCLHALPRHWESVTITAVSHIGIGSIQGSDWASPWRTMSQKLFTETRT